MQFKQAEKIKALSKAERERGKQVPFKRFWDYVRRDGSGVAQSWRGQGAILSREIPMACTSQFPRRIPS
jgi:hypothetical protein